MRPGVKVQLDKRVVDQFSAAPSSADGTEARVPTPTRSDRCPAHPASILVIPEVLNGVFRLCALTRPREKRVCRKISGRAWSLAALSSSYKSGVRIEPAKSESSSDTEMVQSAAVVKARRPRPLPRAAQSTPIESSRRAAAGALQLRLPKLFTAALRASPPASRPESSAPVMEEDDHRPDPPPCGGESRPHRAQFFRSALSTGVTSLSSIATSPAIAALSFVPVNAAHVLRPMRALIGAPISDDLQIVAAERDLVDGAGLLALRADDLGEPGRVRSSSR